MAKSFVRSLIERTLGRYVETDVAALNVALWNGKVVLKDIPLRKDMIDSLGLPIVLDHGQISLIHLEVPWLHLSTKPVKLTIKGVRIRCALRADWDDTAELIRVEKDLRRIEIDLREFLKNEILHSNAKEGESQSYWHVLGLRIMENIQVDISDVNICFADIVEVSVSLDRFSLRTAQTDGDSKSSASSKWASLRKEVSVTGLSVACGGYSSSEQTVPVTVYSKVIDSSSARTLAQSHYLVRPLALSATIVKTELRHARMHTGIERAAREVAMTAGVAGVADEIPLDSTGPMDSILESQEATSPTSAVPEPATKGLARWNVSLETDRIDCQLAREQWIAALHLTMRFNAAADQRNRLLLRPRYRPGSKNQMSHKKKLVPLADGTLRIDPNAQVSQPGDWWKFAVKAMGFCRRNGGVGWSSFMFGFRRRKKFIQLRIRQLLSEWSEEGKGSTAALSSMSAATKAKATGLAKNTSNSSLHSFASSSSLDSSGSNHGDLLQPLSVEEETWLDDVQCQRWGSTTDRAVILDAVVLWRAAAAAEAQVLRSKKISSLGPDRPKFTKTKSIANMVPGSAKKMMKGFSFKSKSKKSKEAGADQEGESFFISDSDNDIKEGGTGLLSNKERERLYASVAAKHEEVALISGTDIWMKMHVECGGFSISISDEDGDVAFGVLQGLQLDFTQVGISARHGGTGSVGLRLGLSLDDLRVDNLCPTPDGSRPCYPHLCKPLQHRHGENKVISLSVSYDPLGSPMTSTDPKENDLPMLTPSVSNGSVHSISTSESKWKVFAETQSFEWVLPPASEHLGFARRILQFHPLACGVGQSQTIKLKDLSSAAAHAAVSAGRSQLAAVLTAVETKRLVDNVRLENRKKHLTKANHLGLAGFAPVELEENEQTMEADFLSSMPGKNPSHNSLYKVGSSGALSTGESSVIFIELNIQVDAPIIVLPADSADPQGAVVVLDLGKVLVVNEPSPCFELIKAAHSSPHIEDELSSIPRRPKREWRMRAWRAQLASVRVLAGSSVGFWRPNNQPVTSTDELKPSLSSHILIDEFSIDIQTAHAISLPLSQPSSDADNHLDTRSAVEDGCVMHRDVLSTVLHGMVLHVDPAHLARLRRVRRGHMFNKDKSEGTKKKKTRPHKPSSPAPPSTSPSPLFSKHASSSTSPMTMNRPRGQSVSKRSRGRTGTAEELGSSEVRSGGREMSLHSFAFVSRVETVEVRIKSEFESPVATLKVQGIGSLGVAQRGGVARMEGSLRSIEIQDHLTAPQFENKVDTLERRNEELVSPSLFVTSLVGSGEEKLIGVRATQITETEYDDLGEEIQVVSTAVTGTFTSLYVNWNPHLVAAVVDLIPRLATSSKSSIPSSPSITPRQNIQRDAIETSVQAAHPIPNTPVQNVDSNDLEMIAQNSTVEYRLRATASMKRLTISLNMAHENNKRSSGALGDKGTVPVQRLFLVAMARARAEMVVGRPLPLNEQTEIGQKVKLPHGITMNGSLQRLEVWSEHGKNKRLLKQRKLKPSLHMSNQSSVETDEDSPPPPPPLSPDILSPASAAPLPNTPTTPQNIKRAPSKKPLNRRVSAVEVSDQDWLTFTYQRPYRGPKGGVSMGIATMDFKPIQVVFVNCQALQLMNYAYHGVTGALFKKAATLASATLDRLGATLSTTITADRPRVVVPLALDDSPALVVDFAKVVMKHRFMQGRLVMEGELDAQGATFSTLKSGLRPEHRNLKPKPTTQVCAVFEPGPLGLKFSSSVSGNAVVSGVQPGGSGELQGIKVKDRVLSVGNRECGYRQSVDFVKSLPRPLTILFLRDVEVDVNNLVPDEEEETVVPEKSVGLWCKFEQARAVDDKGSDMRAEVGVSDAVSLALTHSQIQLMNDVLTGNMFIMAPPNGFVITTSAPVSTPIDTQKATGGTPPVIPPKPMTMGFNVNVPNLKLKFIDDRHTAFSPLPPIAILNASSVFAGWDKKSDGSSKMDAQLQAIELVDGRSFVTSTSVSSSSSNASNTLESGRRIYRPFRNLIQALPWGGAVSDQVQTYQSKHLSDKLKEEEVTTRKARKPLLSVSMIARLYQPDSDKAEWLYDRKVECHFQALQFWMCVDAWLEIGRWVDIDFTPRPLDATKLEDGPNISTTRSVDQGETVIKIMQPSTPFRKALQSARRTTSATIVVKQCTSVFLEDWTLEVPIIVGSRSIKTSIKADALLNIEEEETEAVKIVAAHTQAAVVLADLELKLNASSDPPIVRNKPTELQPSKNKEDIVGSKVRLEVNVTELQVFRSQASAADRGRVDKAPTNLRASVEVTSGLSSGDVDDGDFEVSMIEPTSIGLCYERNLGVNGKQEAVTVNLDALDASFSHDDLLFLTRTALQIQNTMKQDVVLHPRVKSLDNQSSPLKQQSSSSSQKKGETAPTTPKKKKRPLRSSVSTFTATPVANSPLPVAGWGDSSIIPEEGSDESGLSPIGESLRMSSFLQSDYFTSDSASSHGLRHEEVSDEDKDGSSDEDEGIVLRGGEDSEAIKDRNKKSKDSISITISCENGMQVEVIDDVPREPMRFQHRLKSGSSGKVSGGDQVLLPFQIVNETHLGGIVTNAPLFKLQIAACFIIGHYSESSKIVRVDDLAFTVLYYDNDPLLMAAKHDTVPQRWHSLTTTPFCISAAIARDDSTDQVTVNGSGVRFAVNETVVRNASTIAAIGNNIRNAINNPRVHQTMDEELKKLSDSMEIAADVTVKASPVTTIVLVGGGGSGGSGGGFVLVNETGEHISFLSREIGFGGWGRERGSVGSIVVEDLTDLEAIENSEKLFAQRQHSQSIDNFEDGEESEWSMAMNVTPGGSRSFGFGLKKGAGIGLKRVFGVERSVVSVRLTPLKTNVTANDISITSMQKSPAKEVLNMGWKHELEIMNLETLTPNEVYSGPSSADEGNDVADTAAPRSMLKKLASFSLMGGKRANSSTSSGSGGGTSSHKSSAHGSSMHGSSSHGGINSSCVFFSRRTYHPNQSYHMKDAQTEAAERQLARVTALVLRSRVLIHNNTNLPFIVVMFPDENTSEEEHTVPELMVVAPFQHKPIPSHIAHRADSVYICPSRASFIGTTKSMQQAIDVALRHKSKKVKKDKTLMDDAIRQRALMRCVGIGVAPLGPNEADFGQSSHVVRSIREIKFWENYATGDDLLDESDEEGSSDDVDNSSTSMSDDDVHMQEWEDAELAGTAEFAVEAVFTRPICPTAHHLKGATPSINKPPNTSPSLHPVSTEQLEGFHLVDVHINAPLFIVNHCPIPLDLVWSPGDTVGGGRNPLNSRPELRRRLLPKESTAIYEVSVHGSSFRFENIDETYKSGMDGGCCTNIWTVEMLRDSGNMLSLRMKDYNQDLSQSGLATLLLHLAIVDMESYAPGAIPDGPTTVRVCAPCVVVDRTGLGLTLQQPSSGRKWQSKTIEPKTVNNPVSRTGDFVDVSSFDRSGFAAFSNGAPFRATALVPEGQEQTVDMQLRGLSLGSLNVKSLLLKDCAGTLSEYAHEHVQLKGSEGEMGLCFGVGAFVAASDGPECWEGADTVVLVPQIVISNRTGLNLAVRQSPNNRGVTAPQWSTVPLPSGADVTFHLSDLLSAAADGVQFAYLPLLDELLHEMEELATNSRRPRTEESKDKAKRDIWSNPLDLSEPLSVFQVSQQDDMMAPTDEYESQKNKKGFISRSFSGWTSSSQPGPHPSRTQHGSISSQDSKEGDGLQQFISSLNVEMSLPPQTTSRSHQFSSNQNPSSSHGAGFGGGSGFSDSSSSITGLHLRQKLSDQVGKAFGTRDEYINRKVRKVRVSVLPGGNVSTLRVWLHLDDEAMNGSTHQEGDEEESEEEWDSDESDDEGLLTEESEGAGYAGEDGQRMVITASARQMRGLVLDVKVEVVEIELFRPRPAIIQARRSGVLIGRNSSTSTSSQDTSSSLLFATFTAKSINASCRVDTDGFLRWQTRNNASASEPISAEVTPTSSPRKKVQGSNNQSGLTPGKGRTMVTSSVHGEGEEVRERLRSTGTRSLRFSVSELTILSHMKGTTSVTFGSQQSNRGRPIISLDIAWRVTKLTPLDKSEEDDDLYFDDESIAGGGKKVKKRGVSRLSSFVGFSGSVHKKNNDSNKPLVKRVKSTREIIVDRFYFVVCPLVLKTSDRFLWVLLLTQESFQLAGASPWPINSKTSEEIVMKRVKRLRRWIIFVRDMRISSIKLNITYSKTGARSEAVVPMTPSRSSLASYDSMVGSSFSSVSSNTARSKSKHITPAQKYQSMSVNQREGSNSEANQLHPQGTVRGRGSDSSLAFLLRNLKVGINGAQIELKGATVSNWRGSRGALRVRLMHHYVAQLKQWTFTLLSSAAPGFGSWKLFNRKEELTENERNGKRVEEENNFQAPRR